MNPQPSVILVDDHDLFRAGLRTLLEAEGVRVAADTRGAPDTVHLVRQHAPAVVLIDVLAAGGTGTQLAARIHDELPDAPVIVLTRSHEGRDIYRAIRAGARGYVFKDTPVEDLVRAIRAVATGGGWMSPAACEQVMEFIRTGHYPRLDDTDMSERELEVLRLITLGYDNSQIANELSISAKTVKNHVSKIFGKLEVANRVQAAVYAVRSGLS